jgi:hypothetical protein
MQPRSVSRFLFLLALAAFLWTGVASAAGTVEHRATISQSKRLCHTVAQGITNRHGISCVRARQVANRARKALGAFPECTGEPPKYWHEWTLIGSTVGGIGIGTTFTKGSRSFLLSGGGTC